MHISKLIVGDLQCNCYLIEKDNNCLIIDPGAEYSKIKEFIKGKNLIGILLTHHHFDHIGCVNNLIKDYNIPLYDNNSLTEGINHISTFTFEVIKTYGHTMDCLTIGRCDFPESNAEEMLSSIQKIKQYPDDITIYPGHGIKTNLGREKQHNIYFKKELI